MDSFMKRHVAKMPETYEIALDAGTIVLLEFGTFQLMPDGRMDVPWRYDFVERGEMDLEAVEEELDELMRSAKVVKLPGALGGVAHPNGALFL